MICRWFRKGGVMKARLLTHVVCYVQNLERSIKCCRQGSRKLRRVMCLSVDRMQFQD